METAEIRTSMADIRETAIVRHDAAELRPGDARLEIEGFALTANNVTYAATAPVIGYWKFFPSGAAGSGVVPVWGFARVIESRSRDLAAGERLYGFLPMARHLTLTPEARGDNAILDQSPHRRDLPPVYNAYHRAPVGDPPDDALRAIFQPLLITSYLIADFLEEKAFFGAKQVIVGSASSKTGLGLARFLADARPEGVAIVGLTSAANREFVDGLSQYDQAVAYDDIERGIAHIPSVYVDMSGNADVRGRLHHHLGDNIRHSAAVGTSHWDRFRPTGDLPGARPRFFFAPSQIEKRRAEWGDREVERRMQAAWRRVAEECLTWMTIETGAGLDDARSVYRALADGLVAPDRAHYIRLTP